MNKVYVRRITGEISEHVAATTRREQAIFEKITDLGEAAREGDPRAVAKLRTIRDACDTVLSSLPLARRRKRPSPSTPSNQLASLLLEKIRTIQSRRRAVGVNAKLARDLRARIPKKLVLDWANFSQWSEAARHLMKVDKTKRARELIDQIGRAAILRPIEAGKLVRIKSFLHQAVSKTAKSGLPLHSYPEIKALRGYVEAKIEAKKLDYAWRKVRQAAKRIRI